MKTRRLLTLLAVLTSSLVAGRPCRAEEVQWRKDYATALQEAREKRRPLLLDFRTEICFWCDRLEATTFRDAGVVGVLNGQLIPLRLDAAQYPQLVQHLGVDRFPTVVVASWTGQILNRHTGFLEVRPFQEFLRPALAAAAPVVAVVPAPAPRPSAPAWMAADYETAARAVAGSEYAAAVKLLKKVLEKDAKFPVQAKAAELLREVEEQASARLARVKELTEAGQLPEAVQVAQELAGRYDGTAAASEGQLLLPTLMARLDIRTQERLGQARAMLVQAREDLRTQQFLVCLIRCETIAARFADLPESAEAADLVGQITGNPEWLQQVCDGLPDLGGMSFLRMAEAKLKQGQPQQAVFFLERILQAFPNTRHAEIAQVRLSQIQGPPPLPVSSEDRKQ